MTRFEDGHEGGAPEHWSVEGFEDWRQVARYLRTREIRPEDVIWCSSEPSLLPMQTASDVPEFPQSPWIVSAEFVKLCQQLSYHRDPSRWALLYKALWRLTRGEPELLHRTTDELVHRLLRMQKQIRRDSHKTKAFVRFKKIVQADREYYVAWYQPDHDVLPLVADFFSRRFGDMSWTIITPYRSVHWDREGLQFFDGVPRDNAPADEELESLWAEYYRSTFNPARIKIRMMKSEMPVRFWQTLPETRQIPELLAEAPVRVEQMLEQSVEQARSAQDYLPDDISLQTLRQNLPSCGGCDLCDNGTNPVMGAGSNAAKLVLVGEQPGDEEEKLGQPFVGPAGQLLRGLLAEIELDPSAVYLTNSVKHFRHRRTGKKRLHQKPTARQVSACQPWLAAEIAIVQPRVVVCLGTTAMHSLLGRSEKLESMRGQWRPSWASPQTLATWHPAAILRATAETGRIRRRQLKSDLQLAWSKTQQPGPEHQSN